ncbi:MAG TPA: hypothetical protein VFS00_17910, partial [Polyangiaceae bacterium]|nr:hypothetical protein [Polyangiaceae bacterium]
MRRATAFALPTSALAASALAAALASCGRSAPPPEAVASGPVRVPAVASAPPAPVAAPAPLPSTRAGDGCWGVELPPEPAARLDALGVRCAPGLKRLFDETQVLALAASGEATLPLPPLPPNACVRAAAVSAEGPVALALLEGGAEEVALDAHAAFSLAPLEGPICLGAEGRA